MTSVEYTVNEGCFGTIDNYVVGGIVQNRYHYQ